MVNVKTPKKKIFACASKEFFYINTIKFFLIFVCFFKAFLNRDVSIWRNLVYRDCLWCKMVWSTLYV